MNAEKPFCAAFAQPRFPCPLRTIAHDEADHACLDWRCRQWLVTTYAEVGRALADRPLLEAPSVPPGEGAPRLGVLPSAELVALRGQAMVEVIAPALARTLKPRDERARVLATNRRSRRPT